MASFPEPEGVVDGVLVGLELGETELDVLDEGGYDVGGEFESGVGEPPWAGELVG